MAIVDTLIIIHLYYIVTLAKEPTIFNESEYFALKRLEWQLKILFLDKIH